MRFIQGSNHLLRPLSKLIIIAILALVLFVVIVNGIRNPVESETHSYTAEFTDISGLHANADVRIRGVKVGKVTEVGLHRDGETMSARVSFTLAQNYRLTASTKAAVKYANLAGVRYVDITGANEPGPAMKHLPATQTVPSFDITQLFNGLQPVLETLSPEDINQFSANALTLLQGDGSGLEPLLKSVDNLSRYATNRHQVISTLVSNLSRISDKLGGKSPQIIQFLKYVEGPVDSALTVLEEFRKADMYGPLFTGRLDTVLAGLGLEKGMDLDKSLADAFPNIDNMQRSFNLLPTVLDGLQLPVASQNTDTECSRGTVPLPPMGQVLINGNGVVVCKG